MSFTGSTRAGKRVGSWPPTDQAGHARAGRQVGQRPARRRRPGDRGTGRGVRLLHELRPDLLGPDPDARAPGQAGRGRGAGRRRPPPDSPRATRSSRASCSGPLVSAVQRDRVRGYIDKGIEEGASCHRRRRRTRGPGQGLLRAADRLLRRDPDMTIAQEEIFGPVLSIIPYDSEEEAIEIANDTLYGLAGGVWCGDPERAERWPASSGPARSTSTAAPSTRGALRRLQAVRHRSRARPLRVRGVPRDQGHAALRGFRRPALRPGIRPRARHRRPGVGVLGACRAGHELESQRSSVQAGRQATVTRPWRHRRQIPTQTNRRR